jgi:hypothetical protein
MVDKFIIQPPWSPIHGGFGKNWGTPPVPPSGEFLLDLYGTDSRIVYNPLLVHQTWSFHVKNSMEGFRGRVPLFKIVCVEAVPLMLIMIRDR